MRRWLPLVVMVLLAVPTFAQEAADAKKDASGDMMAMYFEMAKPVAEHARLEELAGTWTMTIRFWLDPAAEPMSASGTATGRMILGGRFAEVRASTKAPFESESLTLYGFDRRTSDYTLVGFDTLGTYFITAAGKYDEAEKRIVMAGEYLQPPENRMQKYRFVWDRRSADHHVFVLFFDMADGKSIRVAETEMKR